MHVVRQEQLATYLSGWLAAIALTALTSGFARAQCDPPKAGVIIVDTVKNSDNVTIGSTIQISDENRGNGVLNANDLISALGKFSDVSVQSNSIWVTSDVDLSSAKGSLRLVASQTPPNFGSIMLAGAITLPDGLLLTLFAGAIDQCGPSSANSAAIIGGHVGLNANPYGVGNFSTPLNQLNIQNTQGFAIFSAGPAVVVSDGKVTLERMPGLDGVLTSGRIHIERTK